MIDIKFLAILFLSFLVFKINAQVYEIDASHIKPQTPAYIDMQATNPQGTKLSVNNQYFIKDGKPWFPLMGEMHYNRLPVAEWNEEILKMKSAGLNIIATYIFWNEHEPAKGIWDWKNNRNLKQFIQLCKTNGMYVWLRIGPYAHGEQRNGGFPDWIQEMKGKRTNNAAYLDSSNLFYKQIGEQTKGLYFNDGGPVIGVQLENEYASGQAEHISILKKMAIGAGIKPVYWSVTANTVFNDAKMEVLPLQGAYPYRGWEKGGGGVSDDFVYGDDQWIMTGALGKVFYDVTKFPRGVCEQGCGSQMTYENRFIVNPHVVEAHLQNQIGRGMNLIGYYMFHGGTQTPGLEENGLPLSYDFQSPITEFGLIRPSYKYLKILHSFINDFGEDLVQMQVVEPANPVRDELNTKDLRYIARVNNNSGYLFLCNTQKGINMPDKTVTLKVKLANEIISFPSIILKGETSPILPFNLHVDDVNIKYATAQVFAKIIDKNHTTLFFQKLIDVNPQVVIENNNINTVEATGWLANKESNHTLLKEGQNNYINIKEKNGNEVTLVFLSREEAEQAWQIKINGKDNLIITNADVTMHNDLIELRQLNNAVFNCRIYPSGNNIFSGLKKIKQQKQGLFNVCTIAVKPVLPNIQIQQTIKNKAIIKIPPSLPENLSDVVVKVDYYGGECILSQNNIPVTNNLFNGTTWMIGLQRFAGKGDLTLQIKDWSNTITGVDSSLIKEIKTRGTVFKKIEVLPQYVFKTKINVQ